MNGPEKQEISSRPSTPTKTSWFEFMLNPELLQQHFTVEHPDPPINQLLIQFVDQSIKGPVESSTLDLQYLQVCSVRKISSLKLLALQCAAFYKWNLNTLKQSLPLYMAHKVLKDFVDTVSPADLNSSDVCALDDYVLVALTIYNRWCIQTIIDSGFPTRINKPAMGLQPNGANLNVVQLHDMVIKTVRDTLQDSIMFLERCLPLNRNLSVPTIQSFVHPKVDQCDPKDMVDFTKGIQIRKEEFLCQLCFDLGTYYFHQRELGKAGAMFEKVTSLLSSLPVLKDLIYMDIDASTLDGYLAACGRQTTTKPSEELKMVQRVEQCAAQGYQGIIGLLIEDNVQQTLPTLYREALQHVLKGSGHGNVGKQVAMCNMVKRHLTNTPGSCEQLGLLRSCSVQDAKLLGEIITKTAQLSSEHDVTRLKLLVMFLCGDRQTRDSILQTGVRNLFTSDELKDLEQRQLFHSAVSSPSEPVMANYDNVALQIGQIEQRLIQSNDAEEIDKLITALKKISPAKSCSSIYHKWHIDKGFAFILDGVGNKKTNDFVFMLLVKAQHCTEIKNYEAAKILLEKAHNQTKEFSFKLSKAIQHEILYVELLKADDRQLMMGSPVIIPDFKPRIQACLSSAKNDRDIPPRPQLIEKCVLYLLNNKEWMTVLNVEIKAPYIQLCQLIARACQNLPDLNESRRPARDLWDTLLQMFCIGPGVKRNNSGRPVATAASFSPRSIFLRLVDQISELLCLSILLSCLVRLHNLLKDDATTELSHDYVVLWPSSVTNVSQVDIDAVTTTTIHVLRHVISVDPCHPSWLKTQADNHYANSQYAAALQSYLMAALVVTRFFEVPVPKEIWNEQVYKRLIKCCTNLKCHTQVAILCQFLDPVDYATAFKALQEKICYDAMDGLYGCIWDVAILEFLVHNHHKLNEVDKKQKAIKALSTPELNTSNPDEILQVAVHKRSYQFLRAMCKQYL